MPAAGRAVPAAGWAGRGDEVTEQAHTLVAAYVLDAVSADEAREVERHLARCPSCAAEVADLRETVGRLGAAVAAEPPPELRARVLDAISSTRPVRQTVRSRPRSVPRWRPRVLAVAAAVVVAAVGAGLLTYVIEDGRLRAERERTAAARAEADRIAEVLAAPDAHLAMRPATGGGRVSVVASAARGEVVVTLSDLPSPAADHAYELWLIRDTAAIPAGMVGGGTHSAVRLLDGAHANDKIGVTVEPAAGSPQPTTTPVAVVPLT